MAVKYKLVARKNMSKDAEPDAKLYYPSLVSNGRVSFDALCDEVSEQSSLTSGDVKNCMDRLVFCAAHHLKEGRSVDMGDLGGLRLALRSVGTETTEEYDATQQMRAPSVVFTPGKKLREMRLTGMSYERQTATDSGSQTTPGGSGSGGEEEDGPVVQ